MKAILVIVALVSTLISCRPSRDFDAESAQYKKILLETISASDSIIIAEHSDPIDFESPTPEITYRTTILSKEQRDQLHTIIANSSQQAQQWRTACFFPHHSIRFLVSETQTATLEVCLECRGLRFSGSHFNPPEGLISSIANFLSDLGYHGATSEEWKAKTSQQSEQIGAGNSPKPGA